MSPSWNLLSYPALDQKRRRRHRVTTTLAGLLLGALMAWITGHVMSDALQRSQLAHVQLQAQWSELSQQSRQQQQREVAAEKNRQQEQHLHWISRQHQAWSALDEGLQRQSQDASWRLSRLQLESGQLTLSGWSRDVDSLSAVRKDLSGHLFAHIPFPIAANDPPVELLRQTSISTRVALDPKGPLEAGGLEFVWESPWPGPKSLGTSARQPAHGSRP